MGRKGDWRERGEVAVFYGLSGQTWPYQEGNLEGGKEGRKGKSSSYLGGECPDFDRDKSLTCQGKPRGSGGHTWDSSEMRHGRKKECGQIARGLEDRVVQFIYTRGQNATGAFQTADDLT